MIAISPRLIIAGLAVAAVLAGTWHLSARLVRADWAAADLARERAATVLHAQHTRQAAMAADRSEAQRSAIRARAAKLLPEVRNELLAPIPCVAGAFAPLADLPIPAAVLDRLRRAGADFPAD